MEADLKSKLTDRNSLPRLREENRGKTLCFTNGCFDILHIGHVRCLQAARAMGDLLVLGLNSDSSVRRLKGADRPVNPEAARAEMLAAYSFVDHIVIFEEDTPENIIELLHPDIWVKGGDYNAANLPGKDLAERLGIRLAFVPLVQGISTTGMLDTAEEKRKKAGK